MLNPLDVKIPVDMLRASQIISVALPVGAMTFLLVVLGLTVGNGQPLNQSFDVMTLVLLGLTILVMGSYLFVPASVAKSIALQQFSNVELAKEVIKESSPQIKQLAAIYQTSMIIGSALIEGIAFFAIVVVLLEQSVWALVIACATVLKLFLRIPTESRIQNWMVWIVEHVEFQKRISR